MKVLWFTNVPMPAMIRLAGKECLGYGGHWMSSLFDRLRQKEDIELGVATAFPGLRDISQTEDGVRYYVIGQPSRYPAFSFRPDHLKKCYSIVNDFQPDLIHIHGTERFYGMLKVLKQLAVPTAVSLQGIMHEYSKFRNYFGALNPRDIAASTRILELLAGLGIIWDYRRIRRGARREKMILQNAEGVLGRTEWDRAFAQLYTPHAMYRHVGEVLRPSFYASNWSLGECDRYTIIYTNAGHPRRGTEDLLAAVALLRAEFPEVCLRLAGTISQRSGYGRFLRRRIQELNIGDRIEFLGYLDEAKMVNALKKAHVFAITSYIENSPNSLAEAMLVGLPCVASYVGGIPSMIEDRRTGLLFPAGDVPLLADCIRKVFRDDRLATPLGVNAQRTAQERHNPKTVTEQLISAYHDILLRKGLA